MSPLNWKDSYSSMEGSRKAAMKPHSKKKTNARKVLSAKEAIYRYQRYLEIQKIEEETFKRATDIRSVDQKKFAVKINSLESLLVKILFTANTPLHITSIIEKAEQLGWISNSIYHKYNTMRKAIARGSYMFMGHGKGFFSLRDGFRGKTYNKEQRILRKRSDKIASAKDIVIDVALACQTKTTNGIFPSKLFAIIRAMGYNCSYRQVYRALQDKSFVKRNHRYTCCMSKSQVNQK